MIRLRFFLVLNGGRIGFAVGTARRSLYLWRERAECQVRREILRAGLGDVGGKPREDLRWRARQRFSSCWAGTDLWASQGRSHLQRPADRWRNSDTWKGPHLRGDSNLKEWETRSKTGPKSPTSSKGQIGRDLLSCRFAKEKLPCMHSLVSLKESKWLK
jgi:hypothetical protein